MATLAAPAQLHDVRIVRNVLIPLSDGATLAADLHLPDSPGPHPTLISFYPYRKDDVIGSFAAYARNWFAARGYAHLLVDVRGSGGSSGTWVESMNPVPEGRDGAEAVEWAAEQPWSDGAVGIWGVSYGGLMALATAANNPPHLRAIAPVYGFWDIYRDFVSPGGCPNMLGLHARECVMLAQELAPPTCQDPEGRWLEVWRARLARLEREGPWSLRWPEHPAYDEYWRERVIQLERIEVPTFFVAGWRDLFPQSMHDAIEQVRGPARVLFGPWLHVQPDLAAREPVDWLPLLLRFWEHTLRGGDAPDDPASLVYVQGGGGWRALAAWPPTGVEARTLRPAAGAMLGQNPGDGVDDYEASPLVGAQGGQWDALGTGWGYPLDQGPDDLASLTYTTAPLDHALELAGSPQAVLDVQRLDADTPFDLVAKLVDVAPDGRAELVSTGWLRAGGSGTHRIHLWATAWALATGHRLRLSIACADFPRAWPDATMPRLRLQQAGSSLILPVVPAGIGDPCEPPRPCPVSAAERSPWTTGGTPSWTIERDLVDDAVSVTLGGGETIRLPEGGSFELRQRATARVGAAHPEGAALEAEATIVIDLAAGEHVEISARNRAWRDRNMYWGRVTIDDRPLFEGSWNNM